MILKVSTPDGFSIVDSESIIRIDYLRYNEVDTRFKLVMNGDSMLVGESALNDISDQGFELAQQAIAGYVADKMMNGDGVEEKRKIEEKSRREYAEAVERVQAQIAVRQKYLGVPQLPEEQRDSIFGRAIGGAIEKLLG